MRALAKKGNNILGYSRPSMQPERCEGIAGIELGHLAKSCYCFTVTVLTFRAQSKSPMTPFIQKSQGFCSSAPDRIRTCDLRLRRPTLYPTELRALDDTGRSPCHRGTGETRGISRVLSRQSRGGPFLWDPHHCEPRAAYPGLSWGGPPLVPAWPCSRWGFPCDLRYRRPGALLPHPFTLACAP